MSQSDWIHTLHDEGPWLARHMGGRVPADAVDDVLQAVWASFGAAGSRNREQGLYPCLQPWPTAARHWHPSRGRQLPPTARTLASTHLMQRRNIALDALLWRRVIDDWTLQDLAHHVRLPLRTVKSRLHD